nr:butyrophilin-like protein 2 isoform X2 [Scatophagus argus]XP_046231023.1 butyrophilin-like protein 2 isoform X2 [Scatophagus argus]XP_046231031.1 butyrophilin-like protein 2 isoform X2 [Scatophagus argus]
MCPTQQVRATEGENATLPCHPDQRIDLSNHTVEWTKLNPEETVHVYRRRKDDPGPQSPQYKDRTTLNREDLKTGNLALHISSVNQSDSGTYRCVIPEEAEPCTVVLLIETQDQPGEIETTTRLLEEGELRLMCPTQQVRATEGENATLPCHPDQRIDLSNHTVEWTKLNPEETVHVYRRRKDDPGPQSPQYKDRTTLNREDLKTGNLALHISSVNQSDSGTYRCVIPEEAEPCTVVLLIETQDQPGETETTTRLLEEGKPRLMCPTERVRATEGESVTLLCHPDQRIDLSEDTVDWTVHVYQCGQDDLDPQSPQYRNRTTLNHEDLKTGNLTLHISSVNQSDNGTYRCVIPEEAKCCIVVLPVGEYLEDCTDQFRTFLIPDFGDELQIMKDLSPFACVSHGESVGIVYHLKLQT